MNNMGAGYLANKDWARAERVLKETLKRREMHTSDDWRTFLANSQLGAALMGQKKYAEAEPQLLSGYEGMKQREATIPAAGKKRLTESVERLVQHYEATGQKDKADQWR